MSKHFINARDTIVTEALDGLIACSGGRLARLDGYPDIKVVLRTDWDRSRVAVVSGGGAGHEPAHAGFVGAGLLTAAVSGEIFASPSVAAVLAGIRAVTGPAGCLLIVKNYTGDRLNFGLAAERARAEGLEVEMVIVADDIALPDLAQPRGVAGTLFVHKIAGHLAEAGAPLAEVAAAARAAAADIRSLGVALSSCAIPGQPAEARIGDDEAELGLGIHGEPGVERIALTEIAGLVATMAGRFAAALPPGGADHALILNNLGAVPPIEMGVVAREVLRSPLGARVRLLLGPGPFMTALNMNGFSLSLLRLDPEREAALSRRWRRRPGPPCRRRRRSPPCRAPSPTPRAPDAERGTGARGDDPCGLRPPAGARGRAQPPRCARRRRRHRLDRRRRRPQPDRGAAFAASGRPGGDLPADRRAPVVLDGRLERRPALDLLHRDRPAARRGRRPAGGPRRGSRAHPLLRRRRAWRPHADRRPRPGARRAAPGRPRRRRAAPPRSGPRRPPAWRGRAPAAPPTSAAPTSAAPPTPARQRSPRSSPRSPAELPWAFRIEPAPRARLKCAGCPHSSAGRASDL